MSARVRLNKLTDLNANNLVTIPVQVCGPLGYPLGGVAALLGCLVLGGGALVEVMARCSDTGHQVCWVRRISKLVLSSWLMGAVQERIG